MINWTFFKIYKTQEKKPEKTVASLGIEPNVTKSDIVKCKPFS